VQYPATGGRIDVQQGLATMLRAIVNGQVFDGESLQHDKAVLIRDARILAVVDRAQVPADITDVYDLRGGTLVPGFIDLQVNGGGGVLFTDAPTVASLRIIGTAGSTPLTGDGHSYVPD
jgi:N-acetylglucosamine-6-phosphate deacetylase